MTDRARTSRTPHHDPPPRRRTAPAPPSLRRAALGAQRAAGNRATRRLTARPLASLAAGRVQRAWQRVKRRRFGTLAGYINAVADNIDMAYGDQQANPPQLLVRFTNGNWVAYKYEYGAWIQDYAANTDQLRQAAQQAVPLVDLPANARRHIFDGEDAGNSHSGLHTLRNLGPNDVVDNQTAADANGIYAARVTKAGKAQSKASLMFPADWDLHDISEAIANAVGTLQHGDINGLRYGYSGPGVAGFFIGMRFSGEGRTLADVHTAFPIQYNGATPTNQQLNLLV